MNDDGPTTVKALLELAKSKRSSDREVLFGNITDLFLTGDARLTDRERALMASILQKLISDIEMDLRRTLAARLAADPEAPTELISILANDEIEIAQPILLRSKVLQNLRELFCQKQGKIQVVIEVTLGPDEWNNWPDFVDLLREFNYTYCDVLMQGGPLHARTVPFVAAAQLFNSSVP